MAQPLNEISDAELLAEVHALHDRQGEIVAKLDQALAILAQQDQRFASLETVVDELRPVLESPLVAAWRNRALKVKARGTPG